MEKLLLTTSEGADMLAMGRTKFYEHLDKPGGIPVVRLGRSVRVHIDDVRQFAERQRDESARRLPDDNKRPTLETPTEELRDDSAISRQL